MIMQDRNGIHEIQEKDSKEQLDARTRKAILKAVTYDSHIVSRMKSKVQDKRLIPAK